MLAEIDTPAVDQQLAQAQAQLKVAQAAFNLSEITYKRYQDLFKTSVISAQDFDTAADNYAGARSTVVADQAVVGRLEALEDFRILRAPFDGVVTARNTDIGDYIPAGSGTAFPDGSNFGSPRLRHRPAGYLNSGKSRPASAASGNELPGHTFQAHVVSTAGAVNPTSKRLLTELQAPNPPALSFRRVYSNDYRHSHRRGRRNDSGNDDAFPIWGTSSRVGQSGRQGRNSQSYYYPRFRNAAANC